MPLPFARYLAHTAAGSSPADPNDQFEGLRPLGAGRAQILASNIIHLARENALRTLATHPGLPALYRGSALGITTAPAARDIDWSTRRSAGGGGICLGPHYVTQYADSRQYPRPSCRFRWNAAAGYTTGGVLVIVPGRGMPDWSHAAAATVTTSATMVDGDLTFTTMRDDMSAAIDEGPISGTPATATVPAERGQLREFTAYLGFYNSSNQVAFPCVVAGISLFLLPPT